MSGRATPAESVPWRTTREAAAYVGLGKHAFGRAVARGEIAPIADEGHRRFLVSTLDAYLVRKSQRTVTAVEPRQEPPKPRPVFQLPSGINRITGVPYGQRAVR